MRKIDRYIARTVWFSTLLVLFVIVGIDALSAFIDESGDRSDAYGFAEIGRYVFLSLPGRCYEFIPFAALIGSLIGLGQLASSSELVVMRAAGISNLSLSWTVLKQALLIALLGFLLGEYVAPAAEQQAQSGRAQALYADRQLAPDRGIWRRDGTLFLHVSAVTPDQSILGVTAYQFTEDGWLRETLFADSAIYGEDGWELSEVALSRLALDGIETETQENLFLPTNITPQILALENVEPTQLGLEDLLGYARFLRSQGEDAGEFELATWRKVLQPASVAALVLVAISFIFGPLRDGTLGFRIFAGVMVGVLFRLSEDLLGPASLVFGFPPLYAAVVPIALCVVAGLFLLRKA